VVGVFVVAVVGGAFDVDAADGFTAGAGAGCTARVVCPAFAATEPAVPPPGFVVPAIDAPPRDPVCAPRPAVEAEPAVASVIPPAEAAVPPP
jgi:hypothetical protein